MKMRRWQKTKKQRRW